MDSVIRTTPKVINRRRDHLMMMNFDHLSVLIQDLKLNAFIEQDDEGGYIASFAEIDDLIATGATEAGVLENLVKELIEYSYEYLQEQFTLYFNSPNRRKHFPYVIKVMMHNTPLTIMEFINVQHKGS
ncbi:hypothetical protein [Cohnella silvisoli]|uniref:Uncharacterized protein n=1 Tax=Cohnella silvisoli TaxID=2873699 RepID=A0ABV1KPK8_9BACL|nr:hypothetical protein [Cohnella silvisoli]MCD9022331.1 hypothetical protein [Cohnella silvisoli]